MKFPFAVAVGICAILGAALQLDAQEQAPSMPAGRVFKVDDTGTVVLDPVLEMQWKPPAQAGSSIVSASTQVSVQLNLAAFVGRSGRIYMTLPRTSGPTVRAVWQTGGTLLPGSLVSGERALVYSGTVTGPLMRDLVGIDLQTDGARLALPEALAFGFEIELDQ